jgi:hypothetical protein
MERAMKAQEVIVRALAGTPTWSQAAEIRGLGARSVRRWRWRLEQDGYDGLFDRRRRVSSLQGQRLLALYRDRYQGFHVRHFHQRARRQHRGRFCYAFVKKSRLNAGLAPKHRPRGRRRRQPQAGVGELLHLDGRRHRWLPTRPTQWFSLIAVVDDAITQLLYAQLWEGGKRPGHPDRLARR